jgi:hypothetical protein
MVWHDDPDHPFAGIAEKLKRAEQNIVNLKAEIDLFVQGGEYPVLPHPNSEEWEKAKAYHRDKRIPLRFSVLAGEVVHHLRSCFDHVVWHFSAGRVTTRNENAIEFPVLDSDPAGNKNKVGEYNRKIQAIANPDVIALIKKMQPYEVGSHIANHALLIIHNMDRFDKHRELVIVSSIISVEYPPDAIDFIRKAQMYIQGELPPAEHLALGRALQNYKPSPGVAFRKFGEWRAYPVVKGLSELLLFADSAMAEFSMHI